MVNFDQQLYKNLIFKLVSPRTIEVSVTRATGECM